MHPYRQEGVDWAVVCLLGLMMLLLGTGSVLAGVLGERVSQAIGIFSALGIFAFFDGLWHLHFNPPAEAEWFEKLKFAYWVLFGTYITVVLAAWMRS